MNGIATKTALKIEDAVDVVVNHYGVKTAPNAFGGYDIWMEGLQKGRATRNGVWHLVQGVRVCTDDNTITVMRFSASAVESKVTFDGLFPSNLLVAAIKELL